MKNIIEKCLLFKDLKPEDITLISQKLIKREFRAKESILRTGNENDKIYIIDNGVVRVDTNNNHRRQTLSFLKDGDFFGEITVFTTGKVSANVVSMVSSIIYTLQKDHMQELMLNIPLLSNNIIAYLANRVQSADSVIYDYAFKMLEARVASKLIILMHMFNGKEDGHNCYIDLPITHQDLADFVGTSRETVTKILAKFKDEKLIDIHTKKIIILNKPSLETWGIE